MPGRNLRLRPQFGLYLVSGRVWNDLGRLIGRDIIDLGQADDSSLLVLETRACELIVILTPFRDTAAARIRFPPAALSSEQLLAL